MKIFSKFVFGVVDKVFIVLRACVASYFLINLINLLNISLMYNMLNTPQLLLCQSTSCRNSLSCSSNLTVRPNGPWRRFQNEKKFLIWIQKKQENLLMKPIMALLGSILLESFQIFSNNLETLFLAFCSSLKFFFCYF